MAIFDSKWDLMDVTEKGVYVQWHDYAYQDDLESAEILIEKHPRNSIVLGYYSMHNIAKKYLGDVYSIKIPHDDAHSMTLKALKEKINKESTRKRVIVLMKEAQKEFEIFSTPKPEILSYLLRFGKSERSSQSYYHSKQKAEQKIETEKARTFLDTIVKPFIKIMKELDI